MVRGIRELFLAVFDREVTAEGEEEGEAEEEGRRFVPSPLDLSVCVGHGGRDDEIERELSRIDERAREIEEGQGGS